MTHGLYFERKDGRTPDPGQNDLGDVLTQF